MEFCVPFNLQGLYFNFVFLIIALYALHQSKSTRGREEK